MAKTLQFSQADRKRCLVVGFNCFLIKWTVEQDVMKCSMSEHMYDTSSGIVYRYIIYVHMYKFFTPEEKFGNMKSLVSASVI